MCTVAFPMGSAPWVAAMRRSGSGAAAGRWMPCSWPAASAGPGWSRPGIPWDGGSPPDGTGVSRPGCSPPPGACRGALAGAARASGSRSSGCSWLIRADWPFSGDGSGRMPWCCCGGAARRGCSGCAGRCPVAEPHERGPRHAGPSTWSGWQIAAKDIQPVRPHRRFRQPSAAPCRQRKRSRRSTPLARPSAPDPSRSQRSAASRPWRLSAARNSPSPLYLLETPKFRSSSSSSIMWM